ncbi:gamma-glutamylaminecyclotransferase [Balaenoptera acutorostrata]|uniref:Gamma-glutamylaminecyclotransferase n=1 Tax=Balaenoptera acutorostrata TaxID=9767 RepID=A0A384BFZ6_BALAC|nr:gamma-glutamylaminecyclotransferase [Balaenoptera acutorostrata]
MVVFLGTQQALGEAQCNISSRRGTQLQMGMRLFLKDLCLLFKTQSERACCHDRLPHLTRVALPGTLPGKGVWSGVGARGEAARFPAARDLCVRPRSLAAPGRMAHVFVYGTLKTGQPNHRVLLEGAHGRAAFRGWGRTVEPYPLVIAGQRNIPRLLNLPGQGRRVAGEVYAVDEQMLRFLDEFEGCPDMYQRTRVTVAVEGAGGTLQCFVYTTATYPPEWVHLPYHDDYDSQGEHGLRYSPR